MSIYFLSVVDYLRVKQQQFFQKRGVLVESRKNQFPIITETAVLDFNIIMGPIASAHKVSHDATLFCSFYRSFSDSLMPRTKLDLMEKLQRAPPPPPVRVGQKSMLMPGSVPSVHRWKHQQKELSSTPIESGGWVVLSAGRSSRRQSCIADIRFGFHSGQFFLVIVA